MTTPGWYNIAVQELGQAEQPGKQMNNPRIVEYNKATGLAARDDETPWCGAFMGWLMMKSGIPYDSKNAAWALSWKTFGTPLKEPIPGAIVVMTRTGGGHVTLFSDWADNDHTKFIALGGNQGNKVSMETLSVNDVVAYRWPPGVALPVANQPLRKSGVIHGAATAVGATVIGGITSAPELVSALHQAHDQLSLGGWIGVLCFVLVLAGAGYAIYSRVQGQKADKALGQTPASS